MLRASKPLPKSACGACPSLIHVTDAQIRLAGVLFHRDCALCADCGASAAPAPAALTCPRLSPHAGELR